MNEVQTISTTADVLPAIQSVTTSVNPESVLNSEFTLELDLTSASRHTPRVTIRAEKDRAINSDAADSVTLTPTR